MSDRMSIIQVNFCVFLNIILFKIDNPETDVVFNLEETEDQRLYMVFRRELEAAIPWIVHVDRADCW